MRRRPIILLLLAAGALGVVGVALADPPQTTTAVKALGESPDAQVGPAIAVDPAGGTNVRAVALDSDWRSGPLEAQTGYATGTISSTSGATTWVDRGFLSELQRLGRQRWVTRRHLGSGKQGLSPSRSGGTRPLRRTRATRRPGSTTRSRSTAEPAGTRTSSPPNGPNLVNTDPSITYSPSTGLIYAAYTRQDCGTRRLRDPHRDDGRRRKRRPAHRERLPHPGATECAVRASVDRGASEREGRDRVLRRRELAGARHDLLAVGRPGGRPELRPRRRSRSTARRPSRPRVCSAGSP